MLHFFRRIRQRLIIENRFTRYLLYAVGEILLVVIGILIALQVDNWQHRRESKSQEFYYLTRLEGELEANLKIAEELADFKSFQNKNARLVLEFLKETAPRDSLDQSFYLALEHLTWLYRRDFRRDVWEELKSTGNIDLISNRAFRTRLAHTYSAFEFYTSFEEEWSIYNIGYRRLIRDARLFDYEMYEELTQALGPGGSTGQVMNLPDFDTTVGRIRKIKALDGYLVDIILSSGTGMSSYNRIGKSIDTLLTDLINVKAEL